jgi:hypothetical protein
VADEPRTEYLAHDDGRWIEYTLDSLQQRALGPEKQGGLIVGRDPECDIVIDDDGIEDFHLRLFRGHRSDYIECIAGTARRGEMTFHPGDEPHGGGTFAGWREATWNPDEASPELRVALAVAHDAELEGRHADADAIRLQAGYRKIRVPWRKEMPERLARSEQLLRIRVEAEGTSQVYALGGVARIDGGVTIGGDPSHDVYVPQAGANLAYLMPHFGDDVRIDVLAGRVRELSLYTPRERDGWFRIRRWQRFGIGDAIVQLCRWPKRGETLR